MRKIKVAQIAKENPGTGRDIGMALARKIMPGDCIDLTGFFAISNSFVDEFVRIFLEQFDPGLLDTLKFENAPPIFSNLFKAAKARRLNNGIRRPHFKFQRQSFIKVLRESFREAASMG